MGAVVQAQVFEDRAAHRRCGIPGAVWFSEAGDSDVAALWFVCPCGCGEVARITVGIAHKPHTGGPSWRWNGDAQGATLHPSVNRKACGWHGWLRDGVWERC